MTYDLWLVFLGASVILSLTPGPNGLLVLTHGALYGVRRSIATIAGGVIGFSLLIGLSMSGLGALLAASERAFDMLKWFGAAYLVWLGIRTWRSPSPSIRRQDDTGYGPSPSKLLTSGFLVAVSNPKAILFYAAFLPQFLNPDTSLLLQFVIMASTIVVVEFIYELVLAAGSHRLLPWISRDANSRWFQRVTGSVFVGAGALLLAMQS